MSRWLALLAGAFTALGAQIPQAAPVTVAGTFHLLDIRSPNSNGLSAGTVQTFGATNVTPNGAGGTKGDASQGAVANLPLFFTPLDILPTTSCALAKQTLHPTAHGH